MHSSAFLAVLGCISLGRTHPTKENKPIFSRGVANLNAFRLPMLASYTSAERALVGRETTPSSSSSFDPVEVAKAHLKDKSPDASFRLVDDYYTGSNGITHVRFKQTFNNIDVDNADYNVNIDRDGRVFSYGGNVYDGKVLPEPALGKRNLEDALDAVGIVSDVLGLSLDLKSAVAAAVGAANLQSFVVTGVKGVNADPLADPVYFITRDGDLKLAWRVETDTKDNWLQSYVDKENRSIFGMVDWVSDATYQVYPWGTDSPDEGDRQKVTDPWSIEASEFTWIGDGANNYTTTRGNNGIAQSNPSGGTEFLQNHRPDSADLDFSYDYDPDMAADPSAYADASIAQLFYTANKCHDLFYLLGFDEKAGNFEVDDNGQGGKGGDSVVLNAQDGSGTNNANFATPPDGQAPRMRMYIWDMTTPRRDASFDAGVVIHEYTHGVSNRLTGGPANSNCLGALEAGGLGEGWGDVLGVAVRLKKDDTRHTDYAVGSWVTGNPRGIRRYPHSTSLDTNPLTYADLDSMSAVHDIGTVWAAMLYEVLWNLIDKHGKNDGDAPEFDGRGVPTDGKYLTLKLLIDAMALQPCNPDFVQARDAILDADRALTGGENACEIWRGFAKRGLGAEVAPNWMSWLTGRTNSDKIPDRVC